MIKIKWPENIKIFPEKKRSIGLDIGSSSIKLVELTHSSKNAVVSKIRLQEIDINDDKQQGRIDALKDIFQDIDTKGARISVVINCPQSCMRVFSIPYMPKSEILSALKWEMKNSLPFPIEQAAIDYKILQEVTEAETKKLQIAVARCPQDTVDEYIELLNGAEIKPSVFTQPGYVLKNVISDVGESENKTVAVLDIGYSISELSIFHDKKFIFGRKLPVAGNDFTLGMTQFYGQAQLTQEKAENFKKEYGITDPENTKLLDGVISSADILPLLRPNLEKLITSIERSFIYFSEKEHGLSVGTLFLLGGGSNLKNIEKFLSNALHIPVFKGEFFNELSLNEDCSFDDEPEKQARFASALGAALAPLRDINLLPVEIKQHTKLLIKRSTIEAFVAAFIVITALVYTGMKIKLENYEKSIAAAETELMALSQQTEDIPVQIFIQYVAKQRNYWGDILKEISNVVPGQICLTEINTQEKILMLKGKVRASTQTGTNSLAEFMGSLEKSIFKKVVLVFAKNSTESSLDTFELRLEL